MQASGRPFIPAVLGLLCAVTLTVVGPAARAQTQHGAAPDDQEVILPPRRPGEAEATSEADETETLFPSSPESDRFLRIATGPVRGGYYGVGGVVCDLMNADLARHRIECLVRPTTGSGENISHVLNGTAEMGLVQSDWQSFAVRASEQETGSSLNFDRLRSVAALYPLAFQVLVSDAFGATELSQLQGARVGLAPEGSSQRQLADVVLAQTGVRLSDLDVEVHPSDTDMIRALCAGDLDAVLLVGPAPLQPIDVAISRCDAQLLSVAPEVRENLVGDRAALAHLILDQDTYSDQRRPVETIGFVVTLVASSTLDDRMVAEVARHLIEGVELYSASHPVLASVDGTAFFTDGLTAPVHNGVARYLDTLAADFQANSEEQDGGDTLVEENGAETN